jgi:hypothetical protein
MRNFIEKLFAKIWNHRISRRRSAPAAAVLTLDLGAKFSEDSGVSGRVSIPQSKRAEHLAILGRSGQGKSRLLWNVAGQDIAADRGFANVDLHAETTKFILATVAAREHARSEDLSARLIVIDPADPKYSVGLNPLENDSHSERFVQVAEFAQVLKERWHLDSFGARTDELLRNSLYVLAEKSLTLLELAPLLAHAAFRANCLKNLRNQEIKQYFELRYDQASEPMRAVMREPILNKVSAFTADPRFRHIVGQQRSTFSIVEAMDRGQWVSLDLPKGRLGEQAATLGSLFLTKIKNALFARKRRELFTVFADEVQNLIPYGGGLEIMLSEARKQSVGIVTAHQFLEQHPAEMRAAFAAVGTHIFFQLSTHDAQQVATALDGGKPLAELLKNLPRRHMVVKSGSEHWQEVVVPKIDEPKVDPTDLYNRCRSRWARKRSEVEEEIRRRQSAVTRSTDEVLDDWK